MTVEIFVFYGWWFSNQLDIVSDTHFSCDTVDRELWLAILSSLLCPETDRNIRIGKQGYKQLLDEVFVISRIIKVEVRVISRSRRLRLITLTETLIILDITKTESNNCFIIHWTKNLEVMFLLLHWRQATRVARSWQDYPWKSCTAVIHDMITRDLDMITRDLDMIIV